MSMGGENCIHGRTKEARSNKLIKTFPVTTIGFNNGIIEGESRDTTLSCGQLYRVQSRVSNLIGIASGGTAKSLNRDDGNLNYDSDLVSNTVKFTTEFVASCKLTGIFI